MLRPAYPEAMLRAYLDGFYVPDIETLYFRYEDFRTPHVFVMEYH